MITFGLGSKFLATLGYGWYERREIIIETFAETFIALARNMGFKAKGKILSFKARITGEDR